MQTEKKMNAPDIIISGSDRKTPLLAKGQAWENFIDKGGAQ